jgi:tetratricopeptide (TPR) repeat protein
MMALAQGYARMGDFDKADAVLKRSEELAQKGDIIARLDTLIGNSMVRAIKGDIDQAVPIAKECTDLAEEAGAIACVVASNYVLGDAYMRQNKFGDAKIALDRSNEVATSLEQHTFRPSIVALTKLNASHLGDPNSPGSFEEALAEARELNDPWAEATIKWNRAQTAAHEGDGGDTEQMLSDFEFAASAFEQMEAPPFRARVERDWGNALRALGRTAEGNEKLGAALALFDGMGIVREADEIRATLGQS